jgi:hypothetical protein
VASINPRLAGYRTAQLSTLSPAHPQFHRELAGVCPPEAIPNTHQPKPPTDNLASTNSRFILSYRASAVSLPIVVFTILRRTTKGCLLSFFITDNILKQNRNTPLPPRSVRGRGDGNKDEALNTSRASQHTATSRLDFTIIRSSPISPRTIL